MEGLELSQGQQPEEHNWQEALVEVLWVVLLEMPWQESSNSQPWGVSWAKALLQQGLLEE